MCDICREFTELFAVSTLKGNELTLAWLNLLKQHMTTGRINQIKLNSNVTHTLYYIPLRKPHNNSHFLEPTDCLLQIITPYILNTTNLLKI